MTALASRLLAEVRGAVARGWCAPANSTKVMDTDLAEAIAQEVCALMQAEAAAALSGGVPSYDALLIIAQSVCGALARAGLTDCDDPGEAIDALREGYEKRIAALSVPEGEAVAVLSSIRELLIANDPACLGIDEAADGRPYPIRDEVIAAITRVLTTPQPGDGWRPIAEAPLNGERLLLALSNGAIVIGRWTEDDAKQPCRPTHFQPLPAAPSAKGVA